MTSHTRPREVVLPSDRTIAFAMIVVQSKPEHLSIQEYIKLLRQHIAPGRHEDALSSTHRHLDRSAYWHSLYKQLEASLREVQSETAGLRLELDKLKENLNTARPTPAARKRKKDEDAIPVPRSPKKSKQAASLAQRSAGSVEAIDDFDFAGIGEAGTILMRSFYHVNAILKSSRKTDPDNLARQCVQAATAVSQVVQAASKNEKSPGNGTAVSLKAVLTASSRAVLSLVMAFNRLSHIADGAHVQGQVIYAYVSMFADVMGILADVATTSTASGSGNCSSKTIARIDQKQKATTKHEEASQASKPNETLSLLTAFLCDILNSSNPKFEAHQSLFEGYACVVLNKLSANLYTIVFGHSRGDSIEAEISLSSTHQAPRYELKDPVEPDAIKAAELQAPFLIQLLKSVLATAPAHLGANFAESTEKAKAASKEESNKAAIAIKLKERLQRTLVSCMFGPASTEGGGLNKGQECLRMPGMSELSAPLPGVGEAKVDEWFTEEVWKLLGWEILSQEGSG